MFNLLLEVGWPIWPLLVCSIIALAVILERFIALKPSKVMPESLMDEALGVSKHQWPSKETVAQLSSNSAWGHVLAAGFKALQLNPRATEQDLRTALEGAGREAATRLERYLPVLGTIASVAPLLGLLGTVIGMIEIFGAQSALTTTHSADPAQLARGISTALYATAFGLVVAIPSLIFWRFFRSRADHLMLKMEVASEQFMGHLRHLQYQALQAQASGGHHAVSR